MWILILLWPSLVSSISFEESVAIINSNQLSSLKYLHQNISIEQVYLYHELCQSDCYGSTPCSRNRDTDPSQPLCTPTSFITDEIHHTSYPYCRLGYTCCNPELCRRPFLYQCTYNLGSFTQTLNKESFPSATQYHSTNSINTIPDNSTIPDNRTNSTLDENQAINSQVCNENCNGWQGKITRDKCSRACQCRLAPSIRLTTNALHVLVCAKAMVYNHTVYTQHAMGQYNTSCPMGYTCENTAVCSKQSKHFQHSTSPQQVKVHESKLVSGIVVCGIGSLFVLGFVLSRVKKDSPSFDPTELECPYEAFQA